MMRNEAATAEIHVGIPCFNRPSGLQDTIDCLQRQSFENWTATIHDNASPDPAVQALAEKVCAADRRFRYERNAINIGPSENFRRAAMSASTPYFMWASDDDLWHPDFMSANWQLLQTAPEASVACSAVDSVNRDGDVIRRLPAFDRLVATGDFAASAERFVNDPEILGKANLMYGLFRTTALQSCIDDCWETSISRNWGADVVFMFGFFCRNHLVCHDAYHLHKRQETNRKSKERRWHPRSYKVSKRAEFAGYVERHTRVAPTKELAELARRTLERRRRERWLYMIPPLRRLLRHAA